MLLLVNYRPEYRHEWGQKTHYTQLRLAPLGKEEAEELLTFLLGKDTSLKVLKELILERTEGTPFFMEEVVPTVFPEVEYIFKHALTQEVAYGTLLQEQRKAVHERTGQAMEVLYQQSLDDHYIELAYHYSQSGNAKKAVEYLGLAGQQARQRSANEDALRYLTTALELLDTFPNTPERVRRELTLQETLGPVLMQARGWAAAETGAAYTRAAELCQQVGESAQRFSVLSGKTAFHIVRADYQTARELAEQLLHLGETEQAPALLAAAHYGLGMTLHFLGEIEGG